MRSDTVSDTHMSDDLGNKFGLCAFEVQSLDTTSDKGKVSNGIQRYDRRAPTHSEYLLSIIIKWTWNKEQ